MRSNRVAVFVGVGLIMGAVSAWAHHAFAAEFDVSKPIHFTGVVTKMELVNPHTWIHVDVKGPDGDMRIEAEHIVIATGSRPIEIPGFKIDQKKVCDSTGALALTEVPKRLVVIGGGYIGLELGIAYAKLGSTKRCCGHAA